MKQEALHTLIVARTLFDKAQELCTVDDKFTSSAGLVILQDALELIFYACLIELGVDESKSLEGLNFYQLIDELKRIGKSVPKSGSLKALNKERVVIKHYGQIAEPSTVRNYYSAARLSIDELLKSVTGKDLQSILLSEALKNEKSKEFIANACSEIEGGRYFNALVEIRKAIFTEIEQEYSVFYWKDHPQGKEFDLFGILVKRGIKAPWYTRNKEWIEQNVRDPFDYIQLDHERLRIGLLEWGVSTQDFWNLWRLTPQVFYNEESGRWMVNLDLQHFRGGATEQNARYCLDRAVSLLLKKQSHLDLTRQLEYGPQYKFKVRMKDDQPLYEKASVDSRSHYLLKKGQIYSADAIVPSLQGEQRFIKISQIQEEEPKLLFGYVTFEACESVKEE